MKKTMVAILMGLFLISLVGAVALYSGDSITLTLLEEFEHYSVVGNETSIDLEIEQFGLNVTITIGKYTKTDSFEVIFFNAEKEVIHHYSGGGSSSGSTKTIYKNVTEYIEVDNYVDREVIKEIEVEKEHPIEEINFPWLMIVSGLVFGVVVIYLFMSFMSWKIKKESKKILENLKQEKEE